MTEFWPWFQEQAAPRLGVRATTFQKMFEHLDSCHDPIRIVETGCMRHPDTKPQSKWQGDGSSTLMFDKYARGRGRGASVESIDISPESVAVARAALRNSKFTTVTCADSVETLARMAKAGVRDVSLLYLDALDLDWNNPIPSSHHHLSELMAALPMVSDTTLVVVDDSPVMMDDYPHIEIGGKATFVARYAQSVGAELRFLEWQAGWTNMNARPRQDKDSVEDLVWRARGAVESDRMTVADALYRLILSLTMPPWTTAVQRVARGEACAFFARLAWSKGRYGTAADMYREAIVADPRCAEYRYSAATKCLLPMGAIDTAISEAQRAVRVEPENVQAHQALSALYHERGNLALAVVEIDRACSLAFGDPGPILDKAAIVLDTGDSQAAFALASSVRQTDRRGDAMHVEAMAMYRMARHEEAIERYREAVEAPCRDPAVAHWHMSMAMEAIGQYPDAWREREYRGEQKQNAALNVSMKRFTKPLFNWQEPRGIVHVHAEAGSGDNIALARYLPQIAARGYGVRYECGEDLLPLMAMSLPMVECVKTAADYPGSVGLSPFDYHIPIGSLQNLFSVTVDNDAQYGTYLFADPVMVNEYAEKLPPGRRIGLCWSSGIRKENGPWLMEYGLRKSMHFDTLEPLWGNLQNDNVFVSLQVGPERSQNNTRETAVIDLLPEKPNWDDTAALVAALDLVITVDTAVAHLAGALGKPVWVMAQRDAQSWHWMCWRPGSPWNELSPWYPSARVFRQHEFGRPHYWDDVVSDIVVALRERAVSAAA